VEPRPLSNGATDVPEVFMILSRLMQRRFISIPTLVVQVLMGWQLCAQIIPQPSVKGAGDAERDRTSEAVAKVKSGEFGAMHVHTIAAAGATEAIPALKEQFETTSDTLLKDQLAQTLVKLGDRDPVYWDFVLGLASHAIESGVPEFQPYDAQGKAQPGPTSAFTAWANAHQMSLAVAYENAMINYPVAVERLGETGDARALPYLRRALLSKNYQIQISAAQEAAELHDTGSIPSMINICRTEPIAVARQVAKFLVYFDDPSAQATVDTYLPKDIAKLSREARANGKSPSQ
jgi:hypothetical protein